MSKQGDISLTFGGAGSQEIQVQGRFYYIYSATNTVGLRFAGGPTISREASQGGTVPEGARSVIVSSSVAQTVTLAFDDHPIQNDVVNVSSSVSATVTPGNTLDNEAFVTVAVSSSSTVKAATATALTTIVKHRGGSSASAVNVGTTGVGAASGYELEPGESIAISTTAAIVVYNQDATNAADICLITVREV